jgi:hypothetical protein
MTPLIREEPDTAERRLLYPLEDEEPLKDDDAASVGARLLAAIDPDVWLELVRVIRRRRLPPGALLLKLLPLVRHGPHAAVCELVEAHGPVHALRVLTVLLSLPAALYRTDAGVIVLSRRQREAGWESIDEPDQRGLHYPIVLEPATSIRSRPQAALLRRILLPEPRS